MMENWIKPCTGGPQVWYAGTVRQRNVKRISTEDEKVSDYLSRAWHEAMTKDSAE